MPRLDMRFEVLSQFEGRGVPPVWIEAHRAIDDCGQPDALVMLGPNLLHTAGTRGKRLVVLVWDPSRGRAGAVRAPQGRPAGASRDPACGAAGMKRPSLTYVVTTARL